MKVVAISGGTPPKVATATVSITVDRNLYAPFFSPPQYGVAVLETAAPGTVILTVTAHDGDRAVGVGSLRNDQ